MEYAPKSAMPFALEPLWGDSRRFAGRERADREGCRFDALSPFGHDANGSAIPRLKDAPPPALQRRNSFRRAMSRTDSLQIFKGYYRMNYKFIPILALAFVCTSFSPPPLRAQNRTEIITQARAKCDAKSWAEAEKLYSKAIALDRKEWTAWTDRGYVRSAMNNYDGAIADCTSGMTALALLGTGSLPSRAIVYSNRAAYWLVKEEPNRALLDAEVACEADAANALAWLNRADALYALGDLKNAETCLGNMRNAKGSAVRNFTEAGARQNALKHKKGDANADINADFKAAAKAQNEGRAAEAVAGYNRIIELNPYVAGAWCNRGVINSETNRLQEAIADYSTAISLADSSKQTDTMARTLVNRSNVYLRQFRFAEAVIDLELAVKTKPDYQPAIDNLKTAQEKLSAAPSEALPVLARAKIFIENSKKVQGGSYGQNTDADAAIALLDQFNKDEPGNGEGWLLRGLAEEQAKNYLVGAKTTALPFYEKAISLDPKLGVAYYRRGKISLGRYDLSDADRLQAQADIEKAIELGVVNAEIFAERANLRNSRKDYAGARADLDRALELEPKNEDYLMSRAGTLDLLNLWKEALADRTTLIELKPNSSSYVSRGKTYLELKDQARAFEDFDKAISLSPEDADYYIDRAKAFRMSGEKSKALEDYKKAAALDPDYPNVLPDLSNADKAEALRLDFKRSLKQFSNSSKKFSEEMLKTTLRKKVLSDRIKRILYGDDRKPAAIFKEVEEHIAAGIADAEDYCDRAKAYLSDKKFPLAIGDATKSLAFKMREGGDADTKSSFDNLQAQAFDLRGMALVMQEKFAEGLPDFERAEQSNPQKGEYPFHKGVAYTQLGKLNEAITAYEKAIGIDSTLEQAAKYLAIMRDQRGIGYEKNKDYKAALADYSAAAKANPKSAEYPLHEGNAYFHLKEYDEAIAAYDRALKLKPDLKDAADNRAMAVKQKG